MTTCYPGKSAGLRLLCTRCMCTQASLLRLLAYRRNSRRVWQHVLGKGNISCPHTGAAHRPERQGHPSMCKGS